ncbi:Uncharacterised protein [Legionella sainthelensi]|nr:Uncharacterised protein [Legionella sainthelensi]
MIKKATGLYEREAKEHFGTKRPKTITYYKVMALLNVSYVFFAMVWMHLK